MNNNPLHAVSLTPGLTMNEESHEYYHLGTRFWSTTQIISQAGLIDTRWYPAWSTHVGRKRHLITELHDLGLLDESEVREEEKGELDAWKLFREDTGFIPTHVEVLAADTELLTSGTFDRVGEWSLGEGKVLIDQKGPSDSASYGLQLASYGHLWRVNTGEDLADLVCVHLKSNGKYKLVAHKKEEEANYKTFLAAREVAEWRRESEGVLPVEALSTLMDWIKSKQTSKRRKHA